MKCRDIREMFSPYLDDELSQEERARVEEHVRACDKCAEELRALGSVVDMVRGMPPAPVPQGFRSRVMRAVEKEARAPIRKVLRGYRGLAAIAAALLLVVGAYLTVAGLPFPAAQGIPESAHVGSGEVAVGDAGEAMYSKVAAPEEELAEPADMQMAGLGVEDVLDLYERKVIRNAFLRLEVEDFDESYRRIITIVKGVGGYVQQSTFRTDEPGPEGQGGYKSGRLVLRVPSEFFESAVEEIGSLGELRDREITGQDVTMEYYDLEARKRNAERQEQRLLEILAQAKTVNEILQVERELARVRGEIEVYEGRLRYLNNVTTLSTITVELSEAREEEEPASPGLWDRMTVAFRDSIRAMLDLAGRALVFLAAAAPVLLILAALWLAYRRFRGRAGA